MIHLKRIHKTFFSYIFFSCCQKYKLVRNWLLRYVILSHLGNNQPMSLLLGIADSLSTGKSESDIRPGFTLFRKFLKSSDNFRGQICVRLRDYRLGHRNHYGETFVAAFSDCRLQRYLKSLELD